MKFSLSDIAERFGLELKGPDKEIGGLSTLDEAGPDQLTFLSNSKYASALGETRAAAAIVPPEHASDVESALVTDNPYLAVARVAGLFAKPEGEFQGQSELAYVHPDAEVADDVVIYPFVFVGPRTRIGPGVRLFSGVYVGEDCVIGPGATLYPNVSIMSGTVLGARVAIHAGSVIGSDGFGYAQSPEGHVKVPQTGTVKVGDDVEIGANTTIDRGSRGKTVIGQGVKIDNLCMIAHNVEIGDHSILIAQVGVSGSTKLGKACVLAGQVGVVGHLNIGDGVMIGSQAGVNRSIGPGKVVSGSPAVDHRKNLKIAATMMKLPEMNKTIRRLEKELAALKAGLGQETSNE